MLKDHPTRDDILRGGRALNQLIIESSSTPFSKITRSLQYLYNRLCKEKQFTFAFTSLLENQESLFGQTLTNVGMFLYLKLMH